MREFAGGLKGYFAGMVPGQDESAGKRKSTRTRKGSSWLRAALTEIGFAAGHTRNSYPAAQYQRLAARRGKKKAVIAVGHTFEFSPAVVRIGELIRAGELGDVYYISSSRVNLGIHQKDVSVIWDLAPHDLSMIFAWLDEYPVKVSAMGRDYVQPGLPDVFLILKVTGEGNNFAGDCLRRREEWGGAYSKAQAGQEKYDLFTHSHILSITTALAVQTLPVYASVRRCP